MMGRGNEVVHVLCPEVVNVCDVGSTKQIPGDCDEMTIKYLKS